MPAPYTAHATHWNILARGASAPACAPMDLIPGPLIAINGAIEHPTIVADYWCGVDDPGKYTDRQKCWPPWKHQPTPPQVVTKEKTAGWDAMPGDLVVHRVRDMQLDLPWGSKLHWPHWSVNFAIGFAALHGAREIRILGADMIGAGWSLGPVSGVGPDTPGSDNRWERERKDVKNAMLECKANGIDVYRYFPPRIVRAEEM